LKAYCVDDNRKRGLNPRLSLSTPSTARRTHFPRDERLRPLTRRLSSSTPAVASSSRSSSGRPARASATYMRHKHTQTHTRGTCGRAASRAHRGGCPGRTRLQSRGDKGARGRARGEQCTIQSCRRLGSTLTCSLRAEPPESWWGSACDARDTHNSIHPACTAAVVRTRCSAVNRRSQGGSPESPAHARVKPTASMRSGRATSAASTDTPSGFPKGGWAVPGSPSPRSSRASCKCSAAVTSGIYGQQPKGGGVSVLHNKTLCLPTRSHPGQSAAYQTGMAPKQSSPAHVPGGTRPRAARGGCGCRPGRAAGRLPAP
jgi:hypothetical protein